MVESIKENLESISSLYDSLIDLMKSNGLENVDNHIRYINSIQTNSVSKVLASSEIVRDEIEWVIVTSRNLHRYFDEINRTDFTANFFDGLDDILREMSERRKHLVELLNQVC